jgi:hypothetical protein
VPGFKRTAIRGDRSTTKSKEFPPMPAQNIANPTSESAPSSDSSRRNLLARNPLTSFYVLTFALTDRIS